MKKLPKTTIVLLFILLALSFSTGSCKGPGIESFPDDAVISAFWEIPQNESENWTVGDRIPITLNIIHNSDLTISQTDIQAEGDSFEIFRELDTRVQNKQNQYQYITKTLEVIYWIPGIQTTPPVIITFADSSGIEQHLQVEPENIEINSVIIDENLQIKDLKPQVPLPRPLIWPWVILVLLISGLLYIFILRFISHRNQAETSYIEAPSQNILPPEELALAELNRIESLQSPAHGHFKQHYTLVSDCIRRYFEISFSISAVDRTTSEFLQEMRLADVELSLIDEVSRFMGEADLVKFAKAQPSMVAAQHFLDQARSIIETNHLNRTSDGGEL